MSEERPSPPEPESIPTDNPAKLGPRIRIGSQREQQADRERQADGQRDDAPSATVADPDQGADLDQGAGIDLQAAAGQEVVGESPAPAVLPPEEAGEGTEAESVSGPPSFPPPRVQRVPDDLQNEIDAAIGEVSMDRLMAGESGKQAVEEIEIDKRYRATVVAVHRDSVLFELSSGPSNGVASLKQFEEAPEPGSQLDVIVTGFSREDQLYEVVVPGASVQVADWSDLAEGVVVEAQVTGHNKGGLECEVNKIRGFIPASQVSLYRVEDLSTFVDQRLQCVVTEANPQRRNLVLSHRAVLEREKEESRQKTLEELEIGQTREGVVQRLQNFGAFVDLGGIDGLIHISQLSWDRVNHPSEVLEEGQQVKVRIEKIDKATGKIGLSYRDLMHHPWEGIETKYPTGSIVMGTVSKIMDFGAFVKLEPGVEGLVHISELSHKRVHKVQQVVQEGQEIRVKVLTLDTEAQRIGLSIKAAEAQPEESDSDAEDGGTEATPARKPARPLRGGLGHKSGGEEFGLQW